MVGDQTDMVARLKAALPARWFADATPVLDGVLAGIASVWATHYAQLRAVIAQSRIATASGAFLDMIAGDFFGRRLGRRLTEADGAYRTRIQREMLRERATRAAMTAALSDLTGRAPDIFEPARPADTGAWNGRLGYGAAGRWGSLMLPRQVFITAYRPHGTGIAILSGWGASAAGWGHGNAGHGNGGWGDANQIAGQVSDAEIAATTAATMPTAGIAWLAIEN
ncbi:MAG: hypothetical protein NT133_17635 [Alphaproteobacteria bacterium]|nr:hypothetical protein [Alphaproteobacteria bacterium]